jgi:hypothetical protein
VWHLGTLHLSVGRRVLSAQLDHDGRIAVHLDSDSMWWSSRASAPAARPMPVLSAYDAKYDWPYDADELGPLTHPTDANCSPPTAG